MKSIILSFLLLSTTLSLLPFVAFSRPSTTFIYDNPIVLPTTTYNNNNDVHSPVLDLHGEPLKVDEEYMIISIPLGGGEVYLADLGNTECPSGIVLDDSGQLLPGTPVKFYTMVLGSDLVHENQDINIMFSTRTSKLCANETVWKVGDYFLGPPIPPPRFVETGGVLGNPGPQTLKNWFKIEKLYVPGISKYAYKFRYCPSQYMCPDCYLDCADIGLTDDRGHARLALNDNPFPFGFRKIKKNDA